MDLLSVINKTSRPTKRAIFFAVDLSLVVVAMAVGLVMQNNVKTAKEMVLNTPVFLPLLLVVGVALILLLRLHRIKVSGFDTSTVERIALVAAGLGLASAVLNYLFDFGMIPMTPVAIAAAFFVGSVLIRVGVWKLIVSLQNRNLGRIPVAIYGAGASGTQMGFALRQSTEFRPVFFIDDNPSLNGLVVGGLPVYAPNALDDQIRKHRIQRVLLTMPSVSRKDQQKIVKTLSHLNVEVLILPSYPDMILDEAPKDALEPFNSDQVLGRAMVKLDSPEISGAYTGKVVMVSGAGGSIGAELCRQLVECAPRKIVLFETSEFNLYRIDQELTTGTTSARTKIVARLGSVTNDDRVREVITAEGVEIILHAAAYKHVPLVEMNEVEGLHNNVIGTAVVAKAAMDLNVERFILVSTDKAVRPTNIMGASKRMAELTIQDLQTRSKNTLFSMVRFGNVIDSSGSVLPLFQKQLLQGGPLTVTHPEVTRFFMTIPEASSLVLLAGAYSKGGEVFVLDMGKPRKVMDIARQVIELSGLAVKDSATGKGDIGIKIIGLRPGEKLYEEFLIDEKSLCSTPHPKIFRAQEAFLSSSQTAEMLDDLRLAIKRADPTALRALTGRNVKGYSQQAHD